MFSEIPFSSIQGKYFERICQFSNLRVSRFFSTLEDSFQIPIPVVSQSTVTKCTKAELWISTCQVSPVNNYKSLFSLFQRLSNYNCGHVHVVDAYVLHLPVHPDYVLRMKSQFNLFTEADITMVHKLTKWKLKASVWGFVIDLITRSNYFQLALTYWIYINCSDILSELLEPGIDLLDLY